MSSSLPPGSSAKKGLERCAAHGLVFDATTQAGCVLCRKSGAPSEPSSRLLRVNASLLVALALIIGGAAWLARAERRERPPALQTAGAGAVTPNTSDGGAAPAGTAREPRVPARLTIALSRRAPLSSLAEVQRRVGYSDADVSAADEDYKVGGEAFQLYVPASYRTDRPAGLLVWIDASDTPSLPPQYEAVLEEHCVLWAAARRSGNYRKPPVRVNVALDVANDVQSRYRVDPRRVWVGGFSGGARSASKAALLYPEVFAGGLFLGAAEYVRDAGPDATGRRWRSSMPRPDLQRVAQAKSHGFVLMVGDLDPNRDEMLQVQREYQRDGFAGAVVQLLPGEGHSLPSAAQFASALAHLSRVTGE